jgi:anti-sigma factor RsiW
MSPEVRKELELHLSQCRACQVLYDSSRKTVKFVTESSSFELPKGVPDRIIDRVMAKLRADRS